MVKGAVPKPIENIPGPSCLIPDRTPPISPTESELDIERGLNFGPGEKDDDYGLEPPLSGPLYPSALNMVEDSLRSNKSHWSLPIG